MSMLLGLFPDASNRNRRFVRLLSGIREMISGRVCPCREALSNGRRDGCKLLHFLAVPCKPHPVALRVVSYRRRKRILQLHPLDFSQLIHFDNAGRRRRD